MKKTIILLFALHTAFSCAAQTFRMSQLKGCKWVSYELDGKVNTVWFTDSAYFDENFYTSLNKTATSKMPFYLSNTIEKVFDESKVGTNTSGKYLIVQSGNAKHGYNLVVCEIMGVSGTTLSRADGYVATRLMCRLICNLPEYNIRIFNPLASYC